jgi:N-acylglucosamine 2-epimerase
MPFCFPRSYDHEHGGYLLVRDADGSLIDDDKVFIRRRRLVQLVKKYPYLE